MDSPRHVSLVLMTSSCLRALLDDDLTAAGRELDLVLPTFFLQEAWLWRIRHDQMSRDPSTTGWLVHAVVDDQRRVVGHAGFHGPPDEARHGGGRLHRRPRATRSRSCAAALRALLERATEDERVRTVRATVSPDNAPSLQIVRTAGFLQVGEQWDDEDGLELVFERSVRDQPP
jgi:RimJ/RimL family protein N-acetyltransferase